MRAGCRPRTRWKRPHLLRSYSRTRNYTYRSTSWSLCRCCFPTTLFLLFRVKALFFRTRNKRSFFRQRAFFSFPLIYFMGKESFWWRRSVCVFLCLCERLIPMIERVVLPRVYSKYTFCREILAKKKNNEPFVSRKCVFLAVRESRQILSSSLFWNLNLT